MKTDSFAREAAAFVAAFDRLRLPERKSFGDLPQAEDVRPVIRQAEWVRDQENNPLRDFTLCDLSVITLARSFLSWLSDPGNPERWNTLFRARAHLEQDSPDDFGWDTPES